MKIPVRLVSIDGGPPAGFGRDGEGSVEVADGATLADVLVGLGLPGDEPYATLVNGEPVAARDRARRALRPGDELTVFPPIKGGREQAGAGQLDPGQCRRPGGGLGLTLAVPGPGGLVMPKILDRLREDHKNMARLYDLMGRELITFKTGERPDYELVKKIVDYCLDYPGRIHHPLEDLVFRKLQARNPDAAGIVGDLDQEHGKLDAFTRRFSTALANVLEDELLPRDWFLDVARDFLSFSRRHMQMEEVLFFPAARKNLTPADWTVMEAAAKREIGWTGDADAPLPLEAALREIMAWGKNAPDGAGTADA